MLRYNGFLQSLIKLHKSSSFIPGFPYNWRKKQRNNEFKAFASNKKYWQFWLITLLLLSIINSYAVWQFAVEMNPAKLSLAFLSLTGLTVACCIIWCVSIKTEPSVKFLNGLMEMETYLQRKGLINAEDGPSTFEPLVLVCKYFVFADKLTPWMLGIGAGLNPCMPPNLLISLLESCGKSPIQASKLNKVFEISGLAILNGFFYKAVMEAGVLASVHVLVGCTCQAAALKAVKRAVSKFDVDMIYRKIHILNGLFSESHVGTLFALLAGASVIQTCNLYILFRVLNALGSNSFLIPLPVLLWNIVCAAISPLIVLYIFGTAGSLHRRYTENVAKRLATIGYESRGECRIMLKRQRLFYESCAPLKVTFGVSNYIESSTPLQFVDFSINRFVDLLLLDKET